jgi:hypothetical protein
MMIADGQCIPVIPPGIFHGSRMGAVGLLEATVGILAMNRGLVPAAARSCQLGTKSAIGHIGRDAERKPNDTFVSLYCASFAGGVALVVTKWDKDIGKVKRAGEREFATCSTLVSTGGPVTEAGDGARANRTDSL